MTSATASSFDTMRVWNGEQSRAFEELAFQLLKDRAPSGTRAIRTGNPDGGVEWYATLENGTEWGWQAKHVHGIDALLTAMTNSVQRVTKERSNLRRLTFVISWNLSTGKAGRGGRDRKSQRQKYEDKVEAWRKSIPDAHRIEFDLIQESDLLDELAKPEHGGRRWFWWGDLVLSPSWLRSRYKQQSTAASEKYRPDLQVDVPIQDDLLSLGFDRSIVQAFHHLLRNLVSAITDIRLWTRDGDTAGATFYGAIEEASSSLQAIAATFTLLAGDPPETMNPLLDQIAACRRAVQAAAEHERHLQEAWQLLPKDDPQRAEQPPKLSSSYGVRELSNAMDELTAWLDSPVGCCLLRRMYFLIGQAGSGKTHLLLDATRRALDAGRPAVFLAGAQLGYGNLWASIADQLGLEAVGADVLLRAMDAAGEAASVMGSRFLIFIDALNETTPPDFWRINLPMLRAAIAAYPHVALVVSCRDTYVDLVLEGTEGSHFICRDHPGFAEREVEATQRYFAHYKLEAPKIPLLTPEFTLPLFLRLYCESLSSGEAGLTPEGHLGRVEIFERYLATKLVTVARRYRPSATSSFELKAALSQVRLVLDGLLDEFSRLGREWMSARTAKDVAQTSLGNARDDATKIVGLFQEEGVLTRERLFLGDENDEGIRIVFQAFADYLLLKRRLALSRDPIHDPAITSWLIESSWGITEAATILFPEVYEVEVPDLLRSELVSEVEDSDGEKAWKRLHRVRQLYRSLAETLPYRQSTAISQRTIDLLKEAQQHLSREEFYRVLFTLAPLPGNRLNGDGLHRYLTRHRMPERDSDFGFATYHELFDAFSPAARLARWAAGGPYPAYDTKVIELACIPLCWLLSSPNRFMRDWVTKALVQLLSGHLDVMRTLLERFWSVDDPYVVQRVVAVSYGALLRSEPAEPNAKALVEAVHTLVFTRPVRPDELLLDAARGVVRWGVAHGLLSDAADLSRRPYGLTPPGPPPTEATIEAKYGWHKDQPDDESYLSIRLSVLSMGDFGRYVVESGLRHFSRYRNGRQFPERETREARFIKSRWKKFVASLNDDQRLALGNMLTDPELRAQLLFLRYRGEDLLSAEQHAMLDAVFVHTKGVDVEYPVEGARRWIFRRTLSLGWTPRLFGQQDHRIGHERGREGHKAERWGKKYQWMAYHELLARVADNYQPSRRFGDSSSYEGLHQLIGDREIDPSLPPIEFSAFIAHEGVGASAWNPPPIQLAEWPPEPLDFRKYRGDIEMFLGDTETEPTLANSMFVRGRDGVDWLVLDSFVKKSDPMAYKRWHGLQEQSAIDTLLIPSAEAEDFLAALAANAQHEIRDLVDSFGHTDCCYIGEVGRVGPECDYRHSHLERVTIDERIFQAVATVEHYVWEGSIFDCSIGETAHAILPSTFLQQAEKLTFDPRGPSWLDSAGDPVFTCYADGDGDNRALLVRATFLRRFLAEQGLSLIAFHWFERMELKDDYSGVSPAAEARVNAWLSSDLLLRESAARRIEHGR